MTKKEINRNKELPPVDTSKLDARKFHTYKRDLKTGVFEGFKKATGQSKRKENK